MPISGSIGSKGRIADYKSAQSIKDQVGIHIPFMVWKIKFYIYPFPKNSKICIVAYAMETSIAIIKDTCKMFAPNCDFEVGKFNAVIQFCIDRPLLSWQPFV